VSHTRHQGHFCNFPRNSRVFQSFAYTVTLR
jgi:hypothetical protein